MKLVTLRMNNFKGSEPFEINFTDKTTITGDNAVGKTRIFDAYLWLLFGKDSADRADFEIKPVNGSKVDVEVEATLETDRKTVLMKVMKEKWVKKKGDIEETFSGNETTYYLDGFNVTKTNYDAFINGFIPQESFKILSDPFYFASKPWEERRKIIYSLSPNISDAQIAEKVDGAHRILSEIAGMDITEHKKRVSAMIRGMKKDLEELHVRIKEAQQGKPERLNFSEIRDSICANKVEIERIEALMADKVGQYNDANSKIIEMHNHLGSLDIEIVTLKNRLKAEFESAPNKLLTDRHAIEVDLAKITSKISNNQNELHSIDKLIAQYNDQRTALLDKWHTVNAYVFKTNELSITCPTCGRDYDNSEEVLINAENNFNHTKRRELDEINALGQQIKIKIDSQTSDRLLLVSSNAELEKEKSKLTAKLLELIPVDSGSFDDYLTQNKEYINLFQAREKYRLSIPTVNAVDDSELKSKKKDHADKIDELELLLAVESRISQIESRVKELEIDISSKAMQIAALEKDELIIDTFIKAKSEMVENNVNSHFSSVKFQLYSILVNGDQAPACTMLIKGVPYNSANFAGKVNAGLDVINVLSKSIGVSVPVFIDNRESISEIIPMDCQIINLVKVTGQNKLNIINE